MEDLVNCTEINDSDDEVLGLNDNPVHIRPFNKKESTPNYPSDVGGDWTVYNGRGGRKKRIPKHQISSDGPRMKPIALGSQIIDLSQVNVIESDGTKKYHRMKSVSDVRGFVVNIQDATNFDIDLDVSADIHERYREVISNHYTYKDMPPDYYSRPDLAKAMALPPKVGTTYRCRLKGIGINPNNESWRVTKAFCEVIKLLNRSDYWVTCTLSDIDVYERLLVDIYVHTASGVINLCDYLLNHRGGDPNPLFVPYVGKKERTVRK